MDALRDDPKAAGRLPGADSGAHGASVLDGLPPDLSPLVRALVVQQRAAAIGFDWPDRTGVRAKVDEELAELDDAVLRQSSDDIEDELGDLLFSVVNLARFLPADPIAAITRANEKFERRFRAVEDACHQQGLDPRTAGLDALERLWQQVKIVEQTPVPTSGDGPSGEPAQ